MIKKTSPLSVIAAGAFFVSSLFTIAFTAFFIYLCFRQPSFTVMVIFFLIDVFCCSLSIALIVILRSLSLPDQDIQSIPVVPETVTNI